LAAGTNDRELISRLMLRLLPAQIFLAAIGSINSVISSLFAGNALGADAMGAVGLYLPFNMLMVVMGTVLMTTY